MAATCCVHVALLLIFVTLQMTAGQNIRFPGQSIRPKPSKPSSFDSLSSVLTRTIGSRTDSPDLEEGDPCSNIEGGGNGVCELFRSCGEVLDFVKNNLQTNRPGVLALVRKRLCQAPRGSLIVCCKTDGPSVVAVGNRVELPELCGVSDSPKVTNGQIIAMGSHPWLAAIGYEDRRTGFRQTCGGTIITRRHVISASHCFHEVRRVPDMVLLGEHDLTSDVNESPKQKIKITRHINEDYNVGAELENDLELLTLERDIEFKSHIRAACLPFQLSRSETFEDKFMTVVGWGITEDDTKSNVPREAQVAIVDRFTCQAAYPASSNVQINNKKLCAGHDGKDACQGDSGGPLLYTDTRINFNVVVAGVVSFGIGCGTETHPGVYTDIRAYENFITNNLVE